VRVVNSFLPMMVLLATLVMLTGCQAGADQEAIAPGKFIPTYAIKYGGAVGWPPAEEAARFDLIDGQGTVGDATALASEHGNTWQTLKHLNPHIIILLYQNGPQRGAGNNLTDPNWRQSWVEQTFAKFWSGEEPVGKDADGIFMDNSRPWYAPTTTTDLLLWPTERDIKLVMNFGHMASRPEDWVELDTSRHPPFAAMEEGAFFHPWGTLGREGNIVFWAEDQWLNQVNLMRGLKHVRALMNVHARLLSDAEGLSRMDAVDASGIRVWDALWYAISSFLQGFDTERQNAYMNFTMWVYARFYWLDEFDPQYLHLGSARGDFARLDSAQGHVYARGFDDGWAVVNPTEQDAMGVPVPGGGQARVLNHDNFKQAEAQPLVSQFDLPVHRGVILLKPGKRAGNEDNA